MESKLKTSENKCSCSNTKTVTSYCQECKEYICKDCHVMHHIEHDSEVIDLAEKATEYLGEYQKLSSAVSLIADRRQVHIKQESIKGIIEELRQRLTNTEKGFQEDIRKSLDETLNYLPISPLIKEFERKKMELGGNPDNPVDKLREELSKICSDLLQQIIKNQYVTADKFLASKDLKKYRNELEKINELSSGDMEYIQELGKLKRTSIKYSYNPMNVLGMIRVESEVKRPDRIIQFDREKNLMNVYLIKVKKTISTPISSGFILPYRFITIEAADNIYFVGGDNNHKYYLKSIYLYDDIRGVLTPLADMSEPRSIHSLSSHNNNIYAIAGENSNGLLNSCEQYNIKDDVWKYLPKLNHARCGHSSCVTDKYIYVAFGWNNQYLNSIERLTIPNEKAWEVIKLGKKNSLPTLQIAGMVPIGKYEILVFGGYKEEEKLNKDTLILNIKDNSWKKGKELPEADAFISSEAKVAEQIIYSFGYQRGGLYSYDIKKDKWNYIKQEKIPF